MAYTEDYMDYGVGAETEEERRKRLEAEAASQGGAARPSLGDLASQYLGRRVDAAQQRVESAANVVSNPTEELQRRFGVTPDEAGNTEVQTQTVKTYADGSQEHVTKTQTPAPQASAPVAPEQVQAQPQMAAAPAPAAPVAPAPQPQAQAAPQPTPQPQVQAAPQAAPAAPVAPAAPEVPNIGQLPTPGPATQLAGPMVPGAVPAAAPTTPTGQTQVAAPSAAPSLAQAGAQAQAATEPEWIQAANAAGTDFGKLIDVAAKFPEAKSAIQAKLQSVVEDQRKADEAKKIVADAQAGDPKAMNKLEQALRPTRGKEREEVTVSDYLKAYMYARLGLDDLSKEVQAKISGKDTKFGQVQIGNTNWSVETDAKTGEIVRAKDDEGNVATKSTLNKLAAAGVSGKGQMYTGGTKIFSIPKGDPNEGQEYTSRFNTHSGQYENVITTGPNAGKSYTGSPGLEKRVETNAAITANKQESSKGLIDYRLQQNLKYAGPMAYTRAGANYVGRYNAENGTSLGYNRDGVLVDHNNDNKPVQQNKDGTIAAVQRVEKTSAGTPISDNATAATSGAPDLTKPPAYNPNMSPRENQKAQDNWAAVQKKTRQDFTTGPQGKTVTAMNTAVAHLDTLNEAGTALHGGQIPVANKIVREFANQLGLPQYTNFEGIKHIVGTEVAKAVSGSGQTALADRQAIEKEFDSANSPDQLKGIIKKYQELMGGQLKSQKQTWTSAGLHPDEFDSKLLPRTKKVINETEAPTRSKW